MGLAVGESQGFVSAPATDKAALQHQEAAFTHDYCSDALLLCPAIVVRDRAAPRMILLAACLLHQSQADPPNACSISLSVW